MTTIPKGGLVLVTGANGYIGSHVSDQLLARGFAVRGSVRSQDKGEAIKQSLLHRHPNGHFEYVVVPDYGAPGAYDDILAGCVGVVHVASDMSFRPDPDGIIPPVINGIRNILANAKRTSTIKRFVLTSSSTAALTPQPDKEIYADENSWNDSAVEEAWNPSYTGDKSFAVYAAAKTSAEREAWKFMREEKPDFIFNAVLPNFNIGEVINVDILGSTGSMVRNAFLEPTNEQAQNTLRSQLPQHAVDVQDNARLHVAALVEEDIKNERLLAFNVPVNYNVYLELFRKIDPSKNWPENDPNQGKDLSKIKVDRALEILKRYGQDGWTPLEESVRTLAFTKGS